MVKKLAALAGAGALLLATAGPAFGIFWWGGSRDVAIVENGAGAYSNTGGNTQDNFAAVTFGGGVDVDGADGNRSMTTGDATAYAGALTVANTHVGCGPCASGGLWHKDFAMVKNGAVADANSGVNAQDDFAVVTFGGGVDVDGGEGNRYMGTGGADSTARAWTIVNTHWGY